MRGAGLSMAVAMLLGAGLAVAGPNKVKMGEGKGDLPANTVYIVNQANRRLTFDLSEDRTDWRRFGLNAGKGAPAYTERENVDHLAIRLRTGGKVVTGDLQFGHRYQLYWNTDQARWDVGEIGER